MSGLGWSRTELAPWAGAGGSIEWRRHRVLYGIAVLASLAFAGVAATHSFFFKDELVSLYQLRSRGPWAFLLTPLNVQFVPLHRAATWLLDALVGPSYEGHVLALLLVQLAVLYMLRRVIARVLGDGLLTATLVLAYATYALNGVHFLWFSSGLHRLPYLLATLWAFDRWLDHRRSGRRRSLWGIGVAMLVAEGFYAKGVLLPFHVAAFEACLWARAGGAARGRLAALSLLMIAGTAMAFGAQRLTDAGFADATSPAQFLDIQWQAWKVFSASLVGGILPTELLWTPSALASAAGTLVLAVVGVASVRRDPRALLVWAIVLACIFANVAVLALSNRGAVWGRLMVLGYRYYLDQVALLLPMVAVALARIPATASPERGSRAERLAAGLVLLLMLPNALSFALLQRHRYAEHARIRAFVDTLRGEAQRVRRSVPAERRSVQDELLPGILLGMNPEFHSLRDLVIALDLDLDVRAEGNLLVESDGRIVEKPDDYDPQRRQKELEKRRESLQELRERLQESR